MLRTVFVLFVLSLSANAAFAQAGVLEINQACIAQGCFAGDSPGLPISIKAPGSYRLTSSIQVTDSNAITISGSDVHLDLAGFSVRCVSRVVIGSFSAASGPTSLSQTQACTEESGHGIEATGENVTIRNGTVRSFGSSGIRLLGEGSTVEGVTSRRNLHRGIDLQSADYSVVRNSIARDNGRTGIIGGSGSIIESCVSANNEQGGLSVSMGSMVRNSVSRGNHNGASTGFYGLIHGVVSTDNNYGISPGASGAHGLNVSGGNAISDLASTQDRIACEAIGSSVVCP